MKNPHLCKGEGQALTATNVADPETASSEEDGNVLSLFNQEDLCVTHVAELHASGISDEIIRERRYRTFYGPEPLKQLMPQFSLDQIQGKGHSLVIPTYQLGNPTPHMHVIKRQHPRVLSGRTLKYEMPPNVSPTLDVLPRYKEDLQNIGIPLYITEGAKKADALASTGANIVPCSINGIFGWRGRVKRHGQKQTRATSSLPEFESVALQGRLIILAFDSDIRHNKHVRNGVLRLGRVLASRGATVRLLELPQGQADPKVGVDDFLANGHTFADLEQHMTDLYNASAVGQERFGPHSMTGGPLVFPANYVNAEDRIAKIDDKGNVKVFYNGLIGVYQIFQDASDGKQQVEVRFSDRDNKFKKVILGREEIASKSKIVQRLSACGADVHDRNALEVIQFLSSFIDANKKHLPETIRTSKLGWHGEDCLVLPTGTVNGNVVYAHQTEARGSLEIDREVLARVATWQGAWPFWMILGAALVSPWIKDLKLRRNPIIYVGGDSHSGKTTALVYGLHAWVTRIQQPFLMDGGSSTPKGIAQALQHAGSLPVGIDEVHTIVEQQRLEQLIYQHANQQTYTYGTPEGEAKGGQPLYGTLLLLGEHLTPFTYAGVQNRILNIDTGATPPFGPEAGARTVCGQERAQFLEKAWGRSQGQLGLKLMECLMSNKDEFLSAVDLWTAEPQFVRLNDMGRLCAALWTVLVKLFHMLDLEVPQDVRELPERFYETITQTREKQAPHLVVWEKFMTLIAQCSHVQTLGNYELHFSGELVGYADVTAQQLWIPTRSRVMEMQLGRSAVRNHGGRWMADGLIIPASDGTPTHNKRIPGRTQVQVRALCVPLSVLQPPADPDLAETGVAVAQV